MTTPTDLAAVRAAAERAIDWVKRVPSGHPWEGDGPEQDTDTVALASYALATIPADATAPITAEWLREAWRFYSNDDVHGMWRESFWMDELADGWRLSLNDYRFTPRFTTRHQFAQLAACLGIQPQPPKAKG